jgi:hypothetical protein
MNLLQQIKNDSITARKSRASTAAFLITLYSECAMVGKTRRNTDSTDVEVIDVLKKFKAGAKTIIQASMDHRTIHSDNQILKANQELAVIDQYLPPQLSEFDLREAILQYYYELGDKANMGAIMKKLQEKYAGLYDGTTAARIVKNLGK